MLSPLLYTLYTHDCSASHDTTALIKFVDDMAVIGLIKNNDEAAFREDVKNIIEVCVKQLGPQHNKD